MRGEQEDRISALVPGRGWRRVLVAVVMILLVIVVWVQWPRGHHDETYIALAKNVLHNHTTRQGEITPKEMERLDRLSKRLQFSQEKTRRLLESVKLAYLDDKRRTLLQKPPGQNEITPEEQAEICRIADGLGLRTQVKACVTSPADILASLRQGEFVEVKSLVHSMPETPTKIRLRTLMNTPLGIDVKLQYQKGTAAPSPLYPLDAPELTDLTLAHRDNYRLFVSVAYKKTYLYIFQKDHYRQLTRLFPDPVWSQIDNPIGVGVTYRIPPGEKEWLYLDDLPPDQETATQEALYILASPWPADDLDTLYGDLYRATSRQVRDAILQQFLVQFERRNDPTVQALYHKVFSFKHEG